MEFYPSHQSPTTNRQLLPSIEEREFIHRPRHPKLKSGFTPRPEDHIADGKPPVTELDMEVAHRGRVWESVPYSYYPSVEHRLWDEASKLPPPLPNRPDDCYNFNVWRNFKQAFGLTISPNRPNNEHVEMMAVCYPVNLPKPSVMDQNTFAKYVETSNLFKNESKRRAMICMINDEDRLMKRAAAMSSARNPPIDKRGNILPPRGYRRYEPLMLPPTNMEPESTITPDMKPDMFGNLVKPTHQRKLWKLSFKSNNPHYKEAQDYAQFVQKAPRSHPPTMVFSKKSQAAISFT